jgi:hypothetical protein
MGARRRPACVPLSHGPHTVTGATPSDVKRHSAHLRKWLVREARAVWARFAAEGLRSLRPGADAPLSPPAPIDLTARLRGERREPARTEAPAKEHEGDQLAFDLA